MIQRVPLKKKKIDRVQMPKKIPDVVCTTCNKPIKPEHYYRVTADNKAQHVDCLRPEDNPQLKPKQIPGLVASKY